MDDLIKALQLMRSKMPADVSRPTHCEHDELCVVGVDPEWFTEAEIVELDRLGFFVDEPYGEPCFRSFRFGSA